MLRAENLSKKYAGQPALTGFSLDVKGGEIVGLLGPNGAGKTTAMKIMTGLLAPDSGRVTVAGYDIDTEPVEAKRRFGYVPESPKLYENLSADAFLDVIASLYHLSPEVGLARRTWWFALFGFGAERYQLLKEFSKGMRQKVVIAAALIHDPEVLILDEPFDGLDPNAIALLRDLLFKLSTAGKSIVFSSHIIDMVERLATRICIIHHGVTVAEGTALDIRHQASCGSLEEAFIRLTSRGEIDPTGAGGGCQPL